MSDDSSKSNDRLTDSSSAVSRSSVNLVRSSHSWTEADSAAGFVLRYLSPMRRQLVSVLGSKGEADEALKLLLAHLVSAGFGEHKRGRLRDFLVRGIRSCAKARTAEQSENGKAPNLESLTLESKEWISLWRDCLLERAWRALERHEHGHPAEPVFAVLNAATADSKAPPETLAARINEETDIEIDAATVEQVLPVARGLFAQLIADEVVETLESPSKADVKQEIKALGMAQAFSGLTV